MCVCVCVRVRVCVLWSVVNGSGSVKLIGNSYKIIELTRDQNMTELCKSPEQSNSESSNASSFHLEL